MASQEEIERLVGKILIDPKFREKFKADCAAAAKELNIDLTAEQSKAFSHIEFTKFVEELENISSKSILSVNA